MKCWTTKFWHFFLASTDFFPFILYNNGERNIAKKFSAIQFHIKITAWYDLKQEKQFSIMHHLKLGHMIKVIPNSVHIF